MAFDESVDERTERQHRETARGRLPERPGSAVSESATPEAHVDLGVDERDQAGACAIGAEADRLAVNRQLVAIMVRRVSQLDTLCYSHAPNVRMQRPGAPRIRGLRFLGNTGPYRPRRVGLSKRLRG